VGHQVKRAERFGGDVSYYKIADLIDDYKSEKLHPMDLKSALSEWLVEKLEPARKHFESEKAKKGLEKMRKLMLSSQGTK